MWRTSTHLLRELRETLCHFPGGFAQPDDEVFTEEQIIAALNEHELGAKTADLCRKYRMSEATSHNWKSKYGGNGYAKRLKAPGDGERQAEEAFGGRYARQRSLERPSVSKKW